MPISSPASGATECGHTAQCEPQRFSCPGRCTPRLFSFCRYVLTSCSTLHLTSHCLISHYILHALLAYNRYNACTQRSEAFAVLTRFFTIFRLCYTRFFKIFTIFHDFSQMLHTIFTNNRV